jgi:hypothetical protein
MAGMNLFFGDSMTGDDGNFALSGGRGVYYPALISARLREYEWINSAHGANSLADQCSYIYQNVKKAGVRRIFYLTGTADRRLSGGITEAPEARDQWKSALSAQLRYMAGNAIPASSWSLSDDSQWMGGVGFYGIDLPRYATAVGAWAEIEFTGNVCSFARMVVNGNPLQFELFIDENSQGIFGSNAIMPIQALTNHFYPSILRFPGLGEGPHKLRIIIKEESSGWVMPEWVSTAPIPSPDVDVYLINVPPVIQGIEADAAMANHYISLMNGWMAETVSEARADGYTNITYVDIESIWNPMQDNYWTDVTRTVPDGLHPNATGHTKIAARLAEAMGL